ncbi:hypothetical protein D3C72_705140 [compost metagenome]
MRTASGGHQFVGHDAVVGHELDVLEALFTQLTHQRTGFRVQTTEVDDVSAGAADLGHDGAEVFLATGQAFIQHRRYAALDQLSLGGIRQALAVGVLVVQHDNFLALEHVDDVVAGHDALLVVTPAHTEHGAQATLGHSRVGGAWSDGDDARFVVDLGGRDGRRGAEVTDHAGDFLVGQVLGDRHSLFRFAGVIALDQYDFFPVDPARRVDRIGRRLCTLHVLFAKCRVGACHWSRYADLDVSLSKRRNTQRSCHCEGQKAFLVKRLGHEVVLQGFFLIGTATSLNAQSKGRAIGFLF